MKRLVEPELLDELPAEDPLARHSRNDLQRLNAWIGNARILAGQLRQVAGEPKSRRILDLGAGDGRFMYQVARRLSRDWKCTRLDLLDKQAAISSEARRGF